jgi:hypothetical protein
MIARNRIIRPISLDFGVRRPMTEDRSIPDHTQMEIIQKLKKVMYIFIFTKSPVKRPHCSRPILFLKPY